MNINYLTQYALDRYSTSYSSVHATLCRITSVSKAVISDTIHNYPTVCSHIMRSCTSGVAVYHILKVAYGCMTSWMTHRQALQVQQQELQAIAQNGEILKLAQLQEERAIRDNVPQQWEEAARLYVTGSDISKAIECLVRSCHAYHPTDALSTQIRKYVAALRQGDDINEQNRRLLIFILSEHKIPVPLNFVIEDEDRKCIQIIQNYLAAIYLADKIPHQKRNLEKILIEFCDANHLWEKVMWLTKQEEIDHPKQLFTIAKIGFEQRALDKFVVANIQCLLHDQVTEFRQAAQLFYQAHTFSLLIPSNEQKNFMLARKCHEEIILKSQVCITEILEDEEAEPCKQKELLLARGYIAKAHECLFKLTKADVYLEKMLQYYSLALTSYRLDSMIATEDEESNIASMLVNLNFDAIKYYKKYVVKHDPTLAASYVTEVQQWYHNLEKIQGLLNEDIEQLWAAEALLESLGIRAH